MAVTTIPNLPVIAASPVAGATTTDVLLQPGSVVNAEVLQVAGNLVQIAIANLALEVISEVSLTSGQSLQLAVSQTADGIRLAVVRQGTGAASADTASLSANAPLNAPNNVAAAAALPGDPLTPLQRIAVSLASETAATQQESLAPLFANLGAMATSNSLPPPLQQAVLQVLAQQTSLDPNLSGSDIQSAVQGSGVFLESALASGAMPSAGNIPDLKAALIVLRQTLVTALAGADGADAASAPIAAPVEIAAGASIASSSPTLAPAIEAGEILMPQPEAGLPAAASAPAPPRIVLAAAELGPATPGAALNLIQEALLEVPRAAGDASATQVTLADGSSETAVVGTTTPPPPFRGALPSAQPVALPSIPVNAPLSMIAHRLLDNTDAALARQTLLQVASLPGGVDAAGARIDPTTPSWNFEIPFATGQGTAMAQFEISRDGGGNEVEVAKRVWKARFSLDTEPAGPVHALITLSGERTSVRMWAERPQTAMQLRAGVGELSRALSQAELSPGDIVVRDGAPPQVSPAKAGHFLDRAL